MRCVFRLFFIFYCVAASLVSANNGGFSTIIYHRDSPQSPFHVQNLTKAERLVKAIHRDFARIKRSHNVILNTPEAPLKEVEGNFLMKISLGTPPYEFFALVDTAADMTWIQCHPRQLHYPMHHDAFHPTKSSTYELVKCSRSPCPQLRGVNCVNNVCEYSVSYTDGASSKGVLSKDVMIIESKALHPPVKVERYVFGCGHYNEGFFLPDEAGVIGLGHGPKSLITQLGRNSNGKFSYCLFRNMNGKLNFGHNAILEGPDTVTTPLFKKSGRDSSYYFASLEAMTIGNERIEYSDGANIFLDSGSTLTYFTEDFHVKIVDSIKRQITAKPVEDPLLEVLKGPFEKLTCFEDVDGSFKFIPMTAHFIGGADVQLNKYNMFEEDDEEEGVICLMVQQGPRSVWGNLAQMNFLIGFDVQAETIKFKPTKC